MGSGSSRNLTASAIGKGLTMSAVLAAGSSDNALYVDNGNKNLLNNNNNNNNNNNDNVNKLGVNRIDICNEEAAENDVSTVNSLNEKRPNLTELLASKSHAKTLKSKSGCNDDTSLKNSNNKSNNVVGLSPGAAAALQVATTSETNHNKPATQRTPETNMPIPLNDSRDKCGQKSSGCNDSAENDCVEDDHNSDKRSYVRLNDLFGNEMSDAKYIKRQSIGKGAFGEAYIVERNVKYNPSRHIAIEAQVKQNKLAQETKPQMLYVAKIMDLHSMPARDRHYAQTEIFCLAHTNHFAIIKYYEHYILDSDDELLVIIMEFADHGDLNRNLNHGSIVKVDKSTGLEVVAKLQLYEREAGIYFVQLLLALHHIHSRRMMHRDIKSANVFLTSVGIIKLGDFGFSQKYESTVSSESVAGTFLGTPYYLSPEMWQGMRYGKKADIWAAGIVLYEMLMDGRRPFEARTLPELRDRVLNMPIVLPNEPPELIIYSEENCENNNEPKRAFRGSFSAEMHDLVKQVLERNPNLRPSAEELLRTPVMQHYLCLFEKHVHSLIAADNEIEKEEEKEELEVVVRQESQTKSKIGMLNLPDKGERKLILSCIAEAKALVAKEIERNITDCSVPHYEGVVYKDNRNNIWKERYLMLTDNVLTISLGKGKEAISGTERSKRVPLKMVKSISPCEPNDIVTITSSSSAIQQEIPSKSANSITTSNTSHTPNIDVAAKSTSFSPKYAFAIAMESSNSIIFGVKTAEELDNWLTTLMRALEMN